jgi:integrase/recombinase XerD
MTFVEVIRIWTSGRPETTTEKYVKYAEDWNLKAREMFKTDLLSLCVPQVEGLVRASSKGLCPRTQANRLFILRGFYRCAVSLGIRTDNPVAQLRPPRFEDKIAERIIRHEEVVAIAEAATFERDRLLIELLYGAGLRISEALAMTRKDLLGNGKIKVFGKGQKTAYVRIRPELEQKLLAFAPKEGPIFPGLYAGKPLSRKTAWNIIHRAAIKAGFPKVSPHWFRHAHATEALRRGASLPLVQASLRHSSVTTTMRYSHVIDGDGAGLYLPNIGE